ncbi:MAG TPA: LamG-like jellyroll fold domain-containing protein [Pyrinomonadaceae bacterium]|jgi:hypothetical protein
MIFYRLAFVTCLLLLTGSLQPSGISDITYGPYNGSFIPAGLGLKKQLPTEDSPVQAKQSWSIYCWVKSDNPIDAETLLAGFGEPKGEAGTQRYLSIRAGGRFSFWSGNKEVLTNARITPGKWQLLAVTYEDGNITLYSDGVQVASSQLELLPAATVIHLAPTTLPWTDATHFAGKIANFTLVARALKPYEIRALLAQEKRLDVLVYEAASKTWPVQIRGQDGLRVPQEPATLPKSLAEPQRAMPRPATNNTPVLSVRGTKEWALSGGWRLIEAPKVSDSGNAISRPGFSTEGWMDATVPGTVLTTMVDRGVYPDPDYGLNNFAIPETLNKQAYWYRTEFRPPASLKGQRFTITFQGINYFAQVWLNGMPLGEIKGAFTRGEFEVSALLIPGKPNALAVRVQPPPHPGIPHEQSVMAGPGANGGAMCLDGPTFICTEGWDWIPAVRDRATGIWQEVMLKATGMVKLGDVHVVTALPLPDTSRAAVTLNVPLLNDSARPIAGVLEALFEGVMVRRRIVVAPGRTEVKLSPADFPQLNINKPRLWWPNGYGSPELYHLQLKFTTPTGESDSKSLRFGIRELSYELTLLDHTGNLRRVEFSPTVASAAGKQVVNVSHEGMIEAVEGWVAAFMPGGEESAAIRELADRRASPHLVIRVNGVRIAIKGGNWGLDDSRKRVSRERMEPYFRLHRDAHLTMIRNWCGQNTEEVFYDLADEYGLLVWNDFWLSTQDFNLEPLDPALFLANARDTIQRFRNHPSVAIWCGRNEGVPPPVINEGLDELVRTIDGTRYYIPNSRKINLQDSGPWHYGDPETFFTRRGLGFSTEIGLPSPPSIDTMRMMLPESDRWPPNDAWSYHDWHSKGGAEVIPFMTAMEEELGAPTSLEDFERKAQLINYVSHRAMFEGFNSHLWNPNTGRLMWMTHSAWPSMVWQMYSSDYATYGSFYGIKKACEPLHVQLNLPGMEAAVINNTTSAVQNLRLSARVFSINGEEIFNREERLSVPAGTAAESFRIGLPGQADNSVAFIKLVLRDEAGSVLSENFYWYAAQKVDYRKLNDMATVNVDCTARQKTAAGISLIEIDLTNRSSGIALATELTLRNQKGNARVLPAYASDNFVSLLPGEKRRITVEVPATASNVPMQLSVTGWNVRGISVPIQ